MPETLTYDKLFAGNVMPVVTEAATVVSGAGSLVRGTVLGAVTKAKGTITPGTNINYFVLRRFVDDPTNIIVQGVKASGGTGPGSIKAQATVQELEDSLPTIISRLNSENAI